jgi:hypothetical protein
VEETMTHTRRTAGLWAAAACAFLVGCEETAPLGPESAALAADPVEISLDRTLGIQSHKKLSTDLCSPALGGFTTVSTNPYFPMEVGDQWSYEGEEDDAEVALLITVLDETRIVDGVTTRVIEEREWEDDELLEISWNYYAQAGDGTICYFGEDVDIYEEGGGIVHEGAWCAEDEPNAPGIFMPADPEPGLRYEMEVAPGIAEDRGKIVGTGPLFLEAGFFLETIRVRESNPLDQGIGFKVFANGTGLVVDGPVELVEFTQGASTPGPPTITAQTCGI